MESDLVNFEYVPDGIKVIEHGKGMNVREIQKDEDFGRRVGSSRKVEFKLDPKTAFQWHVHPKMDETFTAVEGELLILTIEVDEDSRPNVKKNVLPPGESLLIEKDSPHLVFNPSGDSITAIAFQEIAETGGQTINFDLT